MRRWLLPESIEDVLPAEAQRIERLRASLLREFALHGYQLVAPPMLEYLDSLLTGSGRDLELSTFKLVDQSTGRMMGVRADITPQVARIDAHLLNRRGVARLCYCGSVLHTLPRMLLGTREPLQLGAEIYGHSGIEADIEIVRLLAQSLELAGLRASRVDISHVGLFRALAAQGGLAADLEEELFALLQAKDIPTLRQRLEGVAAPVRDALLVLPELYGGSEVIDEAARRLPRSAEVDAALRDLRGIASALPDLPLSFDLADLRGFNYHSGVVFAAYCDGHPAALALGGRYDRVGKAFGRGRAATGFSLDLRELARLVEWGEQSRGILAPPDASPALLQAIQDLRGRGDIVMIALPGHEGTWDEAGCDRRLVLRGGRWCVEPLEGE